MPSTELFTSGFDPELGRFFDPPFSAGTDSQAEAMPQARVNMSLHFRPSSLKCIHPPLHCRWRRNPIMFANDYKGRRFHRADLGMTRVSHDDNAIFENERVVTALCNLGCIRKAFVQRTHVLEATRLVR